jgi:hypothetical protein
MVLDSSCLLLDNEGISKGGPLMGYYKQQEIAQQVEEAHRPKPVTAHVAWPTRRLERQIERATTRRRFKTRCKIVGGIFAGLVLVGVGVALGVTL